MLHDYALKGLVGFCKVLYFLGEMTVFCMIVGALWAIAPLHRDVLAWNLIT